MAQARVAIAKSYLDAYSRLPKKQQKKARETLEQFTLDPTRSGLNFERLPGMRDEKVRSLRVDQAYRMIVVQPPRGDIFLAVWVDNHDEAYRWAERKRFEVNPISGVMQVYSVEAAEEALETEEAPTIAEPVTHAGIFEDVADSELLLVGVPEPLLPSVRGLQNDAGLDALAPHLPADASDMLYLLAAGYAFDEALEQASRPVEGAQVDVEDFEAALENELSLALFHVVEGEGELELMLDAPLEQWRLYLHPSQRRIVHMNANGPVRVLGGAGTGKTVVLMHRAKHLAETVFNGIDDRILVTTFTRNLALDIEGALGSLCPGVMDRVEVRNLHAWARAAYEKAIGERVRIIDERTRIDWMESIASLNANDEFPIRFYLEEWDQIVQAQGITREGEYLKARRVGRGTRLGRAQRKQVWAVFDAYRRRLQDENRLEWQDVIREVRLRYEKEGMRKPFKAVLADEVQDFSEQELRLLRAIVAPGAADLFLVGDAHQRIYGNMAGLGRCGIEIRGRSRRLRLNYRTTEQIRARAIGVLEGINIDDLDEGVDGFTGYRSLRGGAVPRVRFFGRAEEEQKAIVEEVERWLASDMPSSICITARTNEALERYGAILTQAGITWVQIKQESADEKEGVRLATMHRLKGLEFKKMLIAGVQEGLVPLALPDEAFPDEASKEDHEKRERCLFYVASTRARDELLITGFGEPSRLIGPKSTD